MRQITLTILLLGAMIVLFPTVAKADPRFRSPINGTPSFYQYYDDNPTSGIRTWRCDSKTYDEHHGTDFVANYGTPIFAAANGAEYYRYDACPDIGSWTSTCGSGYGNHVRIAHVAPYNASSSWITIYGHMAQGYSNVRGLSSLYCSSWVGNAASSGKSTAYHVHFEVRHYGTPYDDPFAGPCSGPISMWVNQNGGLPTTQCQ